ARCPARRRAAGSPRRGWRGAEIHKRSCARANGTTRPSASGQEPTFDGAETNEGCIGRRASHPSSVADTTSFPTAPWCGCRPMGPHASEQRAADQPSKERTPDDRHTNRRNHTPPRRVAADPGGAAMTAVRATVSGSLRRRAGVLAAAAAVALAIWALARLLGVEL